jgi:hypothetical protein
MMAADRDTFRALHSMAQLDADAVGGAVQRGEERRAAGMRRLAARLRKQDALRPGVSAADAAKLLWVLTSFEAFDLLYTGRGLGVDEIVQILTDTAENSLLR